ncbi:MAG: hypothetical protein AUG51_25520 [Acidobacteria bacterium 13_1_20CM_3_53_8]|nr:MAG: hypothetical protein AUG51_25520 [Acidobacteria bacterium 13_1_20CM_3_53_8]
MGIVMRMLILSAAYLLLVCTSACQCSPPISAQKIEHDIVGKTISVTGFKTGKPDTWTFKQDDETKITIAGSTCHSNKARITIDIETRAFAGIAIAKASGRLQLSYERVGDDWILREVENESFKVDDIIIGSPPG